MQGLAGVDEDGMVLLLVTVVMVMKGRRVYGVSSVYGRPSVVAAGAGERADLEVAVHGGASGLSLVCATHARSRSDSSSSSSSCAVERKSTEFSVEVMPGEGDHVDGGGEGDVRAVHHASGSVDVVMDLGLCDGQHGQSYGRLQRHRGIRVVRLTLVMLLMMLLMLMLVVELEVRLETLKVPFRHEPRVSSLKGRCRRCTRPCRRC